jgi:hypothetical protein
MIDGTKAAGGGYRLKGERSLFPRMRRAERSSRREAVAWCEVCHPRAWKGAPHWSGPLAAARAARHADAHGHKTHVLVTATTLTIYGGESHAPRRGGDHG